MATIPSSTLRQVRPEAAVDSPEHARQQMALALALAAQWCRTWEAHQLQLEQAHDAGRTHDLQGGPSSLLARRFGEMLQVLQAMMDAAARLETPGLAAAPMRAAGQQAEPGHAEALPAEALQQALAGDAANAAFAAAEAAVLASAAAEGARAAAATVLASWSKLLGRPPF